MLNGKIILKSKIFYHQSKSFILIDDEECLIESKVLLL